MYINFTLRMFMNCFKKDHIYSLFYFTDVTGLDETFHTVSTHNGFV